MNIKILILLASLAMAIDIAHAAETDTMGDMPGMTHDPQDASVKAKDGPWSYKGRKNPAPYTKNRWDMVPGDGNTATYIAADKLTITARCQALLNQAVLAVDRATLTQCGQVPRATPAPAAPHVH